MVPDATNRERGMAARNGSLPPESVIFGTSVAMSLVRQRVEKVAPTNVPVLIEGEGGTGKELIARWVHSHSTRSPGAFVKVNCAAIPGTLLESELFGYEKGAFTGAASSKPGRVEQANLGTLFLDDIADLDLSLQSKLLHFLQDGRFTRIGDNTERNVDVRLICTTRKDLSQEIEAGRFRADLYYRINVVRVRLPRLRERSEDLAVLAEYFRAFYMGQFEKECEPLSSDAVRYLSKLAWPGNVRELANGIARYVLIGPEAMFAPEGMPGERREGLKAAAENGPASLKKRTKESVRQMEKSVILEALNANQWNRKKTAQALKISYRALIYKIRDAELTERPRRVRSTAVTNANPVELRKPTLPGQ